MTTYKQALKQAKRVGASRSTGDAYLAQNISLIVFENPGLSADMLFDAAVREGLTAEQVWRDYAKRGVSAMVSLSFSEAP